MTGFEIRRVPFDRDLVRDWGSRDRRHRNWPTVYLIDGADRRAGPKRSGPALVDVYVGESHHVSSRLLQHLDNPQKRHLTSVRVVLDDTYNKSVCMDLESQLIQLLAGDGTYRVLNGNDGIARADYYRREQYRKSFRDIFEQLRCEGVFSQSITEIQNSDLYKLSPFKEPTEDQNAAIESIIEGLFADLETGTKGTVVVEGGPGTGKTVVAVYLLKLLADIAASRPEDERDSDSLFADFFTEGYRELLAERRIGFVVPQQSLRGTIKRVFKRTPGLDDSSVLSPFDVGKSDDHWAVLIVDEAHRLSQRASLGTPKQNADFHSINTRLFGEDDTDTTQLDWIRARSDRQILLMDIAQGVRPADLPVEVLRDVVTTARADGGYYELRTQMRVKAEDDYIGYVRGMLAPGPVDLRVDRRPRTFDGYQFRMFDNLGEMQDEIRRLDAEHGLARLVAGFAWKWISRGKSHVHDFELDGRKLRWNVKPVDWIHSATSLEEVGSIHTVQGYDLNYAGVIIGPDLRFDEHAGRLRFDRANYFDTKGKQNIPRRGIAFTDDDLLRYITNIYAVLMTRGMLGTFVYVCDLPLRRYLQQFVPGLSR